LEKTILVLDGVAEGKTSFIKLAKEAKYWVWNINHKNVLSVISRKIGWDGTRNKKYYDFLEEFNSLANAYLDFENWYAEDMIKKFLNDEKAQILIIHNCNKDISNKLQLECDEYKNVFSYNLLISDNDEKNEEYCKTLNFRSDNFKEDILSTLKIITNNKENT
jgi:hypothetical protein